MKDKLTEYDEWAKMSPEEKEKQLYLTLDSEVGKGTTITITF